MRPCLILSIIRYISRIKWSNTGKGVAPSPTPWCSNYRKGSLQVTFDYGRKIYLLFYSYNNHCLQYISQGFSIDNLIEYFCKNANENSSNCVRLCTPIYTWIHPYVYVLIPWLLERKFLYDIAARFNFWGWWILHKERLEGANITHFLRCQVNKYERWYGVVFFYRFSFFIILFIKTIYPFRGGCPRGVIVTMLDYRILES